MPHIVYASRHILSKGCRLVFFTLPDTSSGSVLRTDMTKFDYRADYTGII